MPIVNGKYKNPGWRNNQRPAIDAAELNAISDTLAALDTQPPLPSLTTPGTAGDLLAGKQLIDANGNVLTGTMPKTTQATPSISVNSSGLITATGVQSAGYVPAGTKNATLQLSTQSATTITPGTAAKTAVAEGRYTTGSVTVEGSAGLVAENIKDGISIFGVTGNYKGTGGGTTVLHRIDPIYNKNISPTITTSYWEISVPATYNRVINSAITEVPLNLDEIVAIGTDGMYDGARQGTSSSYTPIGFVFLNPFSDRPVGFGAFFVHESSSYAAYFQGLRSGTSHSGRKFRYTNADIVPEVLTDSNVYIIMNA